MKVEYSHMIDLICNRKSMINFYWHTNSKLQNEKKYYARVFGGEIRFTNVIQYIIFTFVKSPILIFWRFVQTTVRNYYKRKIDSLKIPHIIKKINNGGKAVYVFDQSYNPFYIRIVKELQKVGIKSIAVPHGHNTMANELIWSKSFSIYPNEKYDMEKFAYDYVVFENYHIANRYKKLNVVDEKQIKVLGSSRFCNEWVNRLRPLLPVDNRLKKYDKYFKILFFLSKPHYNGNPNEVIRTIKFMSMFKNTIIVLKPHTRGMSYKGEFNNNVIVVDNSYQSPSLIDWSDLTVFTHTSVIFDCLQMDKPALYLKYTHSNKLLSEMYFTSWQVECRDDLRSHLLNLLDDSDYRTYSINDRDQYCKEAIQPEGEDVLQNYADFILDNF